MNRLMLSALGAIALAASLAAPASSASTATDVVDKVIAASEAVDAKALVGLYADNAIFVDEGPVVIYGPNVGRDWALRVQKEFAENHLSDFKATASDPTVSQINMAGAYIVIPMELNARIGTHGHYHESGTFTFTLVQQNGEWKITSQVWTVLTKSVG